MSLVERVRAALKEWRDIREVPGLGGLVFEWDGDPLVGVVHDELLGDQDCAGRAEDALGDVESFAGR